LSDKLIRDIGLDPASGQSDEYDIGKLSLLEYALGQAVSRPRSVGRLRNCQTGVSK